jgi:hypothetical protein
MNPAVSSRGFAYFDDVPSEYGGGIRAYESSAADAPHIWIKIRSPKNIHDDWMAQEDDYAGDWDEAVVHLTVENAALFAQQIMHLVNHHYQGE